MKKLILLITLLSLFMGCSKITVLRTKEITRIQENVDSLKAEIMKLEKELAAEQEKMAKANHVETSMTLERVDKKVDMLSDNLTDTHKRISEIYQKVELLVQNWAEVARKDSLRQAKLDAERMAAYSKAENLYNQARYKAAVDEFSLVMEKYPKTKEYEKAFFYRSETQMLLNKYALAKEGYKDYFKEFPTGEFACTALYKWGVASEKLEKPKERDFVWTQLKERCPDSPEVQNLK